LRSDLRPVLAPWWPGLANAGESSDWSASGLHALVSADLATWVLGTPAAPAVLVGAAWWVPLIWAQFRSEPEILALSDEAVEVRLQVEEVGAATWALAVSAPVPQGPAWRGVERPLWTGGFAGEERQGLEVSVERRRLGAARVPVQTYVPHVAKRTRELAHACAPAEAAAALAAWARAGGVEPCWVPAGHACARMLAPVAAGATSLVLDPASAAAAHPHLALLAPDGRTGWARVLGAPAGNVVPVQAVLGSWDVTTSVQPLLLTVVSPTIGLRWYCPGGPVDIEAEATEEPEDYVAVDPAGETWGTSYGPVAPRAWLYAFGDGVTTWRYTSWDVDLVRGGHTWASRTMSHGGLRETLDLSEGELRLQVDAEPGHPVLWAWMDRLGPPLFLQVLEVSAADAGATPVLRWTGHVRAVHPRGRVLEVRAAAWSAVLGRRIPAAVVQPTCWKAVYGAACGVDEAQWRFSAELVDAESPGAPWSYRFGSLAWRSGAALPSMPAHWWAGGRAERTLAGGRRQIAAIVDSEAWSGGTVRLFLTGDLRPWPAAIPETGWTLVRGCAGTWEDCGVLGNRARFGGLPHLPKGNPSFVRIDDTPPAQGKK
jgi:hypothetical protein